MSVPFPGRTKTSATERSYSALKARFSKLVADGSIVLEGSNGVAARDIPFASPSGAASIACGRTRNGRNAWKTADGLSYGDWEERDVAPPLRRI